MKAPAQFLLIFTLITFSTAIYAGEKYVPKDFKMDVQTKGFKGVKANVTSRLDAPVKAVWKAVLDANNHAGKYPRMQQSFCMSAADVQQSKKEGLRNGATVNRRFKKKQCHPHQLRQEGETWNYHVYQEFDYPFPLADRWVMALTTNDETGHKSGKYSQKGKLIFGRQDIFEFRLDLKPHPQYPNQTKLDLYIWSDPGGIIADWMIREATKYVAPKFMETLEREGQKWVGK